LIVCQQLDERRRQVTRQIPEGLTAKFKHWRYLGGGATECVLLDANGELVASGVSVCSEEDNFDRSIGRLIALERALFELHEPEEAKRRQAAREARGWMSVRDSIKWWREDA
jgi:hypothetical protein